MTTLWDTTGTEVVKALAAERRAAGALAFGLALTLVVVVDEKNVQAAEQAASTAAAAHPCRLLMVVRRSLTADTRLDAEVSIGSRLGPGEAAVLRMYGRLILHAESVTLPLLAPDAPVVTWWYGEAPERIAFDPLGVFADRRITDSAAAADPLAELRQRAADYAPGDTDLAWARTTPWRALLAAAFDSYEGVPESVTITAGRDSTPAALLSGWLMSRLRVPVRLEEARGTDLQEVSIAVVGGDAVRVTRKDSRSGILHKPDSPDRTMPLATPELGELLAEELRRLDADATYCDALSSWSGIRDLAGRPSVREHVWRDPEQQTAAGETAGAVAGVSS